MSSDALDLSLDACLRVVDSFSACMCIVIVLVVTVKVEAQSVQTSLRFASSYQTVISNIHDRSLTPTNYSPPGMQRPTIHTANSIALTEYYIDESDLPPLD